jgi:hypothetical protein
MSRWLFGMVAELPTRMSSPEMISAPTAYVSSTLA